jgi:hypothetical protein
MESYFFTWLFFSQCLKLDDLIPRSVKAHKLIPYDPSVQSSLTSDLPLNRTEKPPFFRRSFWDRNPEKDSKDPD